MVQQYVLVLVDGNNMCFDAPITRTHRFLSLFGTRPGTPIRRTSCSPTSCPPQKERPIPSEVSAWKHARAACLLLLFVYSSVGFRRRTSRNISRNLVVSNYMNASISYKTLPKSKYWNHPSKLRFSFKHLPREGHLLRTLSF